MGGILPPSLPSLSSTHTTRVTAPDCGCLSAFFHAGLSSGSEMCAWVAQSNHEQDNPIADQHLKVCVKKLFSVFPVMQARLTLCQLNGQRRTCRVRIKGVTMHVVARSKETFEDVTTLYETHSGKHAHSQQVKPRFLGSHNTSAAIDLVIRCHRHGARCADVTVVHPILLGGTTNGKCCLGALGASTTPPRLMGGGNTEHINPVHKLEVAREECRLVSRMLENDVAYQITATLTVLRKAIPQG